MKKLVLSFLSLIFLTGCTGGLFDKKYEHDNKGVGFDDLEMIQISSKDELKELLKQPKVLYGGTKALEGSAEDSSLDFTKTNDQVEGVNESDNVVTDGNSIYTFSNNNLVIVNKDMSITKKIDYSYLNTECDYSKEYTFCQNFYPYQLLVDDNYVIVIGNSYKHESDAQKENDGVWYWNPGTQSTKVFVYDKNDSFNLMDEYDFDGYLNTVRKVENKLLVITNNHLNYYEDDVDLPSFRVNEVEEEIALNNINVVKGMDSYGVTNIFRVSLDTHDVESKTFVGYARSIYVSLDNIYIVSGKNDYNNYEDELYYYYEYKSRSALIKYSYNDSLEYEAFGVIDGTIVNQFSLDEYEGVLRIATTERYNFNRYLKHSYGEEATSSDGEIIKVPEEDFVPINTVNNRMYTLNSSLEVMDVVDNLGKVGESIQSVRFDNEIAYLVTFLRTDPLYSIDLSDPNDIEVLGELEISGFSTYQQKLDDNHLVSIGFEADNDGRVIGLKVSLYDTSDLDDLVLIDNFVMLYDDYGYVYSSGTYNHKDFLLDEERGIISFPLSSYSYHDGIYNNKRGYLLLSVDTEGIEKLDFIEHPMVEKEENYYWYYNTYIKKGLFIGYNLYTVSNDYVVMHDLNDLNDEVVLRITE